jgi:thioester reductase-like protein
MDALMLTGFPGFLGSALLPRLLARRPGSTALCLVQPQHLATARERIAELEREHPHLKERVELLTGDVTAADLGLDATARTTVEEATEVWHLAAVYDLSVPHATARRVNVDGTAHVLSLCRALPRFARLQYVSTCYVSGRYAGEFGEDVLAEGQRFRNHYESTKYEAEQLVRAAMAGGLAATIYRPGIVVGDSTTGETLKFDGPYFIAEYLRRQPGPVAIVPKVGDADVVRVCLVPRDFVVDAMDALSVLDISVGRTYALTDPSPPTAREVVDAFSARLGKRAVWVPLPLVPTRMLIDRVPGMERLLGLPAEAVDYFASPTTYSTTNTTADLEGSGVRCPSFGEYADRLVDFMRENADIGSKAMI